MFAKSLPLFSVPLFSAGYLASKKPRQAECLTEQEAAEEFQRILESNNGEMPSDPEEMAALLARSRPSHKRNPPTFERLTMGARMSCKAHRQNNGFIFELPVPLG